MTGAPLLGGRDLAVGTTYRSPEYELTEDAIVEFAQQWDPQYFHLDAQAATASPYGGLIASGIQTMAVMQRLTVQEIYAAWKVIAGRALREVEFLRPVRPGARLHVRVRLDAVEVDDERGRADVTSVSELLEGDRVMLRAVTEVVVHA